MMKTIEVRYWKFHFTELIVDYPHASEYAYSLDKQREVIEYMTGKGYSVMLRPMHDRLLIWVNKGGFGQS